MYTVGMKICIPFLVLNYAHFQPVIIICIHCPLFQHQKRATATVKCLDLSPQYMTKHIYINKYYINMTLLEVSFVQSKIYLKYIIYIHIYIYIIYIIMYNNYIYNYYIYICVCTFTVYGKISIEYK